MSSPAEVVVAYLIAEGGGTTPTDNLDWPIYSNKLPTSPHNAMVVRDTEGTTDGRIHGTGESIIHPGIQVTVRGETFPVGHAKIVDIAALLDAVRRDDHLGYRLQSANRGPIAPLATEEDTQRELFVVNALLTIKEL